MTKSRQFIWVFCGTIVLASLISHALIHLSNIETAPGRWQEFGAEYRSTPLVAAGSSVLDYGVDWQLVSKEFSRRILESSLPGGSPCELEALRKNVPESDVTVIGVAMSDMDEGEICDFRAEIVPIWQSIQDLRASGTAWPLAQRTLNQYPLRYTRLLFPTVGRAVGVLDGVRQQLVRCLGSAAAKINLHPNIIPRDGVWPTNRVSDWTPGRLLRNVEARRAVSGGHHDFAGPKHLALARMLQRAAAHGKAIVVVLPQSPLYLEQVVDADVARAFEESMTAIAKQFPAAKWIRLDRLPQAKSNDMFYDLVHPNLSGRRLETATFLNEMEPIMRGS